MNNSEALMIIQSLADGVDPRNGERFPAESAYQDGQTVRALVAALQGLQALAAIEKRRKTLPENVGKAWSPSDEKLLSSEFDSGKEIGELAKQLQRTAGAVRARLVKLGKIEADPSLQRYRALGQ